MVESGPATAASEAPTDPEAGLEVLARILRRLRPAGGRWLRGALPLRFVLREISPQSLRTGSWQEAPPFPSLREGEDRPGRGGLPRIWPSDPLTLTPRSPAPHG